MFQVSTKRIHKISASFFEPLLNVILEISYKSGKEQVSQMQPKLFTSQSYLAWKTIKIFFYIGRQKRNIDATLILVPSCCNICETSPPSANIIFPYWYLMRQETEYANNLLVETFRKTKAFLLPRKPRLCKNYNGDMFRIIGKARSSFHLAALESIYISTKKPLLCRQKEFVFTLGLHW